MGFSALQRYEKQKAFYDAYKAWDNLTPAAKQAKFETINDPTKTTKPEREQGFISPFNQLSNTLNFIQIRVLSQTQSGQGSDVAVSLGNALDAFYTDSTEPAPAGGAIKVTRFKAAKLAYTSKTAFAKSPSRITGRSYLKPDVDTVSAPFGQSVGGQDYAAALVIITPLANTWVNAATAPAKRSYKFTPEG